MALGRLGRGRDEDCVVVTASLDGELMAVLHLVPWGKDGLCLDVMRRARRCDNGINELLITRLLQDAPSLGIRRVSLNFAVLRSALERGARLGAGPVLRAWGALLLLAARSWPTESLYRFNAKFAPVWRPRYLCYRGTSDLPRVAMAAVQTEAFLPQLAAPRWLRALRRIHLIDPAAQSEPGEGR